MRRLRSRFGPELVILGVHAPKFPAEKDEAAVRNAVSRNGIDFPVLNDPEHVVRELWAVNAWPTTTIVDVDGRIAYTHRGEVSADVMARAVDELAARVEGAGASPIDVAPEQHEAPGQNALLRFPGGIACRGERLWVADTGHDRIVELALSSGEHGAYARLVRAWGGGPGLADGALDEARFKGPRGLCLDGGRLLVADTGNHAVREIALESGDVRTVAGNGSPGGVRIESGPATESSIRSPWDVEVLGDVVLISMAGSHQIWLLSDGTLGRFAGAGDEGLRDGEPGEAALAQPAGIAMGGNVLWVADSESSAIRRINLTGDPEVSTVVGRGLFAFGDQDGTGLDVRLQHPLDLVVAGLRVLIADTYNHKVRMLDPSNGDVITIAGSGVRGRSDGILMSIELNEPEALAVEGTTLYIADSGNHRIVRADLESLEASTLLIAGEMLKG